MKCDEAQPTCRMCRNAGLVCGGYEKNIFFDFEDPPDGSTSRFRRPLLTELERKCMSEQLTSSIPPRLAHWHISRIDEECEDTQAKDIQVCRGPFGAFRLTGNELAICRDSPSEALEDHFPLPEFVGEVAISENLVRADDDVFLPSDGALTPRTQQLFQTFLDHPSLNQMSPGFEIWNFSIDSGRVQEVFDDIDITMPELQQPTIAAPTSQPFSFSDFIPDAHLNTQICSDAISIAPSIESNVPHDAVFLLKHYSTTVLKLLTPYSHSKTPWHVLFIPHAKNCLAALTLGENMDHASLCAFYGTLAISAFSLSGVSQSPVWLEQGKRYKCQARDYATEMLKTAYDTPKTAKYKSILMALLTLVQLFMVTGDRLQTECAFLEAEKFIRVKGLNRRKSRKVRLLHHCYAFERMFHESTFIDASSTSRRQHLRKAIESSGASAYSQDSLSFRLSDWSNLEQEMLRIKGQEEGENDLHLQHPGVWSATLYPEIFAVPEQYIFLLSLIIRLEKEMDGTEHQNTADTLSLKQFFSRAKAVERCIKQLREPTQATNTKNPLHVSQNIQDNLLDAMQHALAIYFYRKIYNLDPSMLQPKVIGVRDCLLRFESAGSDMAYGSARLIWPAFVAACEAEDPEVQVSFSDWFQNSALRSGLRFFDDTRENVERIWEEKRNAKGNSVTWMDLMRMNVPLVEHL